MPRRSSNKNSKFIARATNSRSIMASFHPRNSQPNGVSDKKLVESKCLLRTFLYLYVYNEKKVLGRIVDSEKVETAVSLDPFCIIRPARYEDSDDPQKLVERISLSISGSRFHPAKTRMLDFTFDLDCFSLRTLCLYRG